MLHVLCIFDAPRCFPTLLGMEGHCDLPVRLRHWPRREVVLGDLSHEPAVAFGHEVGCCFGDGWDARPSRCSVIALTESLLMKF